MMIRRSHGVVLNKLVRGLAHRLDSWVGSVYPLEKTLKAMASRPFELHLELTNLCNANCVFCPYQFQTREIEFMSDPVFYKAVGDFVAIRGGSVGLTPIVGDALIDPRFIERVRCLRSFKEIDRIWLTTNGILLDRHGIKEVLNSGLTSITISTTGFDESMYQRVFRSTSYRGMKQNVLNLLEENEKRSNPLTIVLALRPDRPLEEVMGYPDFQPILDHHPQIDFTWAFTSAGGRVTRQMLPEGMKLRTVRSRPEPCVNLYNGPIVLPDGTVMGCGCVAAMDAAADLGIGNILEGNLSELWAGERMRELRSSFRNKSLNKTCSECDMYCNLELYRTSEGRERARINRARQNGGIVQRAKKPSSPFEGG